MKINKRYITLGVMLLIVLTLAGCADVYDSPIGTSDIGVGWVQWIVEQIANLVVVVSDFAGGSYVIGLTIITLLIRLVGWPIYAKSTGMSTNMQFAQPEINKLQEKYAGKNDEASKRAMQQEMMKIYKKYDINPLGCLLPFLQMPIFIAMYQVVRRIPLTADYDYLNYNFLWFNFKDQPTDSIFDISSNWTFLVFAVLVGATMFAYQRYSMKKPDFAKNKKYETALPNQSQNTMKYMTYFLTFMITTVAYTNLGIAYYWIIGNGFSFAQTYVNRKKTAQKMAQMKG